jgi:hypothetical protein
MPVSIEALDPAEPEHLASFHALRLRAHPRTPGGAGAHER